MDADLKRAREYVQHEQGNIQDIQSWLSSARAQAQSAIDQHKDQIALHQVSDPPPTACSLPRHLLASHV